MKAMKGMKKAKGKMMKMMKKGRIDLKVIEIVKFLKDTDYCPVEGAESGRQMLIKMAPFVLGKGAAADQRAEKQAKALGDLEDVLRGALKYWYDKVKALEDEVASAEEKKQEAHAALENAESMLVTQAEEISQKQEEIAEATVTEKEARKALRKSKGAEECVKEAEKAKAKLTTLTEALKAAKAAEKTIAAGGKAATKDIEKTSKVVVKHQASLAVEQVGLEKAQGVFAKFKALRDRKAKTPPRKRKSEPGAEDEDGAKIVSSPSFLDRVASRIMGMSPTKSEPTEE
jgi:hypothetical protein